MGFYTNRYVRETRKVSRAIPTAAPPTDRPASPFAPANSTPPTPTPATRARSRSAPSNQVRPSSWRWRPTTGKIDKVADKLSESVMELLFAFGAVDSTPRNFRIAPHNLNVVSSNLPPRNQFEIYRPGARLPFLSPRYELEKIGLSISCEFRKGRETRGRRALRRDSRRSCYCQPSAFHPRILLGEKSRVDILQVGR